MGRNEQKAGEGAVLPACGQNAHLADNTQNMQLGPTPPRLHSLREEGDDGPLEGKPMTTPKQDSQLSLKWTCNWSALFSADDTPRHHVSPDEAPGAYPGPDPVPLRSC